MRGTGLRDGRPMEMNYDEYRKEKTSKAIEYQDFVCTWMAKNYGIVMTVFSSKKYQYNVGETLQGIEIKYDMMYGKTGNIYIETGEKASPRIGEYYNSGIYRNDNTWLYFIGDYDDLYVFSKKQLIKINEKKMYYKFIENNNTSTSCGFLLDKQKADNYCIIKFNLKNVVV